jgi:hypothetical protein
MICTFTYDNIYYQATSVILKEKHILKSLSPLFILCWFKHMLIRVHEIAYRFGGPSRYNDVMLPKP